MEWQLIETAPKDGTSIILCWAIDADCIPIDWTKDPKTAGVFVQVASWQKDINSEDGEWIVYCGKWQSPRLHFMPTHWMPLPDAPK